MSGNGEGTHTRCVRILVTGRVQGVWFRDSTRRQADALGISGWVRNLHDGRVEAVFEGSSDAVEAALTYVRTGPPGARVDHVDVERLAARGDYQGFELRRTE